jgi:hypothetical protein
VHPPTTAGPGDRSALTRRDFLRAIGAVGVTVGICGAALDTRHGTASGQTPASAPASTAELYPGLRNPFSHAWGRPLGDTRVAPTSAAAVADLVEGTTVGSQTDPQYGFGLDYLPLFVVASHQALIRVTGGLGNTDGRIPIPDIARRFVPSRRSGDSPLVIVQPETGRVWEMFEAVYDGAWSVGNAGVMYGDPKDGAEFLSGSTGVFSNGDGLSASGISYAGTMITQADIRSGAIRHTLALTLSNQESTQYWPPANRADGNTADVAGQLAEGMWFRMPNDVRMPSGLTPFAKMVFTAMQTHGAVVVDRANGTYLRCESPETWAANDQKGKDPITEACRGVPEYEVVKKIPLKSMEQILPPALGGSPHAGPAAPGRFTATAGKAAVTLRWEAPRSSSSILFYLLRGRRHGHDDWVVLGPNPTGSPAQITDLVSGDTYDFQVAAVTANTRRSTGAVGTASAIITATAG